MNILFSISFSPMNELGRGTRIDLHNEATMRFYDRLKKGGHKPHVSICIDANEDGTVAMTTPPKDRRKYPLACLHKIPDSPAAELLGDWLLVLDTDVVLTPDFDERILKMRMRFANEDKVIFVNKFAGLPSTYATLYSPSAIARFAEIRQDDFRAEAKCKERPDEWLLDAIIGRAGDVRVLPFREAENAPHDEEKPLTSPQKAITHYERPKPWLGGFGEYYWRTANMLKNNDLIGGQP